MRLSERTLCRRNFVFGHRHMHRNGFGISLLPDRPPQSRSPRSSSVWPLMVVLGAVSIASRLDPVVHASLVDWRSAGLDLSSHVHPFAEKTVGGERRTTDFR